jgi:hypothetical protein
VAILTDPPRRVRGPAGEEAPAGGTSSLTGRR